MTTPDHMTRTSPSTEADLVGARVLVVEDDSEVAEVVALMLERAGIVVTTVGDGRTGLEEALSGRHDLVLLDVLLPGIDGFEVCRRILRVTMMPIVMLTARTATADTVAGLELGADDYLTKPFEGPELVARVRSVLRRTRRLPSGQAVALGPFRLDPAAYKAWKDDRPLTLTVTEFRLLQHPMSHPGRVLTRKSLMRDVWRYEYPADTRLVDMAVLRLREKMEAAPAKPLYVKTVRRVGYRFDLP